MGKYNEEKCVKKEIFKEEIVLLISTFFTVEIDLSGPLIKCDTFLDSSRL